LSPGQQVITAGQYNGAAGALVSMAVASSDAAPPRCSSNERRISRLTLDPIGTSLMMAGILFVGLVAYPLLPSRRCARSIFRPFRFAASLPGAARNHGVLGRAAPLGASSRKFPGVAQ